MARPMETPPLTTLLSWAWIALVIEADNAFEVACRERPRRAFRISFAMWANGLRGAEEHGVTVAELRSSSRAACNLAGLERWGWIALGDATGPGSARARRPGFGSSRGIGDGTTVRPTAAGTFARRAWPEILEQVEHRWEERFGVDTLDRLRAALGDPDERMPWSLPEVHASDGFWTHIHESGAGAGDDAGAGAGARGQHGPTGRVPLAALLAQTLTRLTLDHESHARVSLPLAANGLRVLADEPVPIRDLPVRSGVSKEAVAMLTGYLDRNRLAEPGAGRTIALTASGTAALGDYEGRAATSTGRDLGGALQALLGRREELASGLAPPPGCWRGEPPYLRHTTRLVADPTGALPWHPMVLHRGGWPDGS